MPQTTEQKREWYLKHRERHLERSRARHAEKRASINAHIAGHLVANHCVDCGESDPIVLDFDHVEEKRFNIANAAWKLVSISVLADEISRCVIRCANCHRRKTHQAGAHRSARREATNA
jgi:hypothetical protein